MPVLPIRLFGDPVLTTPADEVTTFDAELRRLVRSLDVVAKGFTASGDPVQVVGNGHLARCLQHETDHLDGVLFIDRMDRERRKAAMRAIREADWNVLPKVKLSPHPMINGYH